MSKKNKAAHPPRANGQARSGAVFGRRWFLAVAYRSTPRARARCGG
jgi:hypothetical protein